MEESLKTKGIILRREVCRENDSRVFVYTQDFGKLELLARGTQKLSSKLAAHIEPLNLIDLMVIKGKKRDYLGSAIACNCYVEIKNDLDKIAVIGRVLNLFNRLVREGEIDQALFSLLLDFLEVFSQSKKPAALLENFFILKLLDTLGYRPELFHCLNCQADILPGLNYFNPGKGGVICGKCSNISQENVNLTISDDCIKIMRFGLKNDFSGLDNLACSSGLLKELNFILNSSLHYIN